MAHPEGTACEFVGKLFVSELVQLTVRMIKVIVDMIGLGGCSYHKPLTELMDVATQNITRDTSRSLRSLYPLDGTPGAQHCQKQSSQLSASVCLPFLFSDFLTHILRSPSMSRS